MANQISTGTIVSDSEAGNFPWRWICWIRGVAYDSSGSPVEVYGTGFLVGPRLILTAGHNLYEPGKFVDFLRTATVTPFGNQNPFGSQIVVAKNSFKVNKEYFDSGGKDMGIGGPSHDYGFIFLAQTFGNKFGYFAVSYYEQDEDLKGLDNIVLAGFPSQQGILWSYTGKILYADTTQLHYQYKTIGGESGSPLFHFTEGKFSALGIHTNAFSYPNGTFYQDTARRITRDIRDEIDGFNKSLT
jgi:glutamyl endopeptidase